MAVLSLCFFTTKSKGFAKDGHCIARLNLLYLPDEVRQLIAESILSEESPDSIGRRSR